MNCLNCGLELKRNNKYCSNKCQQEHKHKIYISKWKNGEVDGTRGTQQISLHVKRYLMEKYNKKCQICGWGIENPYTHTVPLEIHHRDNNPNNNSEPNLELLCPNCHSLTENWKGSNKCSKRTYRRKSHNGNPEQE